MSCSPEAAFLGPLERFPANFGIQTQTVGQAVEPGQFAFSTEADQRYLFPGAGLESHRGAGGNIEPHAERGGPVELHCLVDLEEMEVRTDLDRPITGIAGLQLD